MGITLLTKEIKSKNIFYRIEVQYRDDVPTKRMVVSLYPALRTTSISIFVHLSKLLTVNMKNYKTNG